MLAEAPSFAGTKKGRPGIGVVANRTQLWGPSADFSHDPDQLQQPLDRIIPGFLQGIGANVSKNLPIQPQQVSMWHTLAELKKKVKITISDDRITYSVVLPLQLPIEGNLKNVNTPQIAATEDQLGQENKNRAPDFSNNLEINNAKKYTYQCMLSFIHDELQEKDLIRQVDFEKPEDVTKYSDGKIYSARFVWLREERDIDNIHPQDPDRDQNKGDPSTNQRYSSRRSGERYPTEANPYDPMNYNLDGTLQNPNNAYDDFTN